MKRPLRALLCITALSAAPLARGQDADLSALRLADSAPVTSSAVHDWRFFIEGAGGQYAANDGSGTEPNNRASADFQLNTALTSQIRGIVSDRLDWSSKNASTTQSIVNTLREAYVSGRVGDQNIIDVGRVNQLYGVGVGYNPTDLFRSQAIRSLASIDPNSLKENRLGSVMLREQALWSSGSLTAIYSPKLADGASTGAFNPDLGATNDRNRWLLALSQKVYDEISPQFMIYGGRGTPQVGFNLTALPTNAVVTYFEWSGGRSRSQLDEALDLPGASSFHQRLSTGMTYTTSTKVSFTLEYESNNAAVDGRQWKLLRDEAPAIYWQYRDAVQGWQELATKQSLFAYVRWQDAFVRRLDLDAMLRFSLTDHSRLAWGEARYHLDRVDLSLQFQADVGNNQSEYAPSPFRYAWQAVVRYYF